MSTNIPLPLVGNIDELLEMARRGVAAGNAMDAVKGELATIRNDLYYKLLNAPDERVLGLRAELKAIEKLAKSLLVKEAQGEAARQHLMKKAGLSDEPREKFLAPATAPRKVRRASGQPTK